MVFNPADPLPFADALKWNSEGLIPAIIQDAENGDVLMMAWMDESALKDTLATGQTHFFSRSRRAAWHKGATSGHVQHVESIWLDCDGDVLLIKARQVGGACHEGYRSCFFRRAGESGRLELASVPIFDAAAISGSTPRAQGPASSDRIESSEGQRRDNPYIDSDDFVKGSKQCASRD